MGYANNRASHNLLDYLRSGRDLLDHYGAAVKKHFNHKQ